LVREEAALLATEIVDHDLDKRVDRVEAIAALGPGIT